VVGMITRVKLLPPPPGPPPDSERARLSARLGVRVTDAGVHFEFVVANVGQAPAIINFPSGQRFDIWVQNSAANQVWRWSATRDFAAVPGVDTIPPGRARVYSADWTSPDVRGRMLGVAQLTSSNVPIGAVEMFSIP
jgi:Intracellular proteinase inhibitor